MMRLNYPSFPALVMIEAVIVSEQKGLAPDVWWLMRLKLRLAVKDRVHRLVRPQGRSTA